MSYTIEVSEPIYRMLNQQARYQSSTVEVILERLLSFAPSILPNVHKTTTQESLDAVHRLTTLFADVRITDIEEVLHDPMIELANSDLDIGLI